MKYSWKKYSHLPGQSKKDEPQVFHYLKKKILDEK